MCTRLKHNKLVSTDELSETYPSGCGLLLGTGALIPEESREIDELTVFIFAVGRRFVTRKRRSRNERRFVAERMSTDGRRKRNAWEMSLLISLAEGESFR